MDYFENFNLTDIVTPVNVQRLKQLLLEMGYDQGETAFLIDGFTNGFDNGYRGPQIRQSRSSNISFTVGNKVELWNKIMKEV